MLGLGHFLFWCKNIANCQSYKQLIVFIHKTFVNLNRFCGQNLKTYLFVIVNNFFNLQYFCTKKGDVLALIYTFKTIILDLPKMLYFF